MSGGLYAGGGVALRFLVVSIFYGWLSRLDCLSALLRPAIEGPGRMALTYSSLVHAVITCLVVANKAPGVIGKDPRTGQLPWWSWLVRQPAATSCHAHLPASCWQSPSSCCLPAACPAACQHASALSAADSACPPPTAAQVWWPFHSTNRFFARAAKNRHKGDIAVAAATEVYPGWWLGGWYSYELGIDFGTVVDLCCELPERASYRDYLCCPNWDGKLSANCVRRSAKLLAAAAAADSAGTVAGGGGGLPILVHCAHGVGRSTCVMVAGMVEAGIFATPDEAFAHIKLSRPTVKKIGTFTEVLADWAPDSKQP
jgi:hypothetical protein